MPLILTEQQRQIVRGSASSGPIEVIDPGSDASYVLLRAEVFAHLAAQGEPYPARDGVEEPDPVETR